MKCSYCDSQIKPGTGKIYILKNGKILRFCSSKCEKHMIKHNRKHAVKEKKARNK